MRKILISLALVLLSTGAFATTSTINPNVPGASSSLSSGPLRNNFTAAYNDINNIYASALFDVPFPSAGSLGGVLTFAPSSHIFITGLDSTGTFHSAQPAFTDLSGVNGITTGGTGQTTALAAFNALSPMTTSGDLIYGGASGSAARIASNATGTNKYLQSVSSGIPAWAQVAFSDLSGSITPSQLPALTGDVTTSAGSTVTTLATVNSNVGSFGSSTSIPNLTVNGKGLVTAAGSNAVVAPAGTLTGNTLASGVTTSFLTSFGVSPVLVTPILGTPTSGTLTNATGLPISTGVSGLGTGVSTFLSTPSSANLLSALTTSTGTGSAVFSNSPTLVTPALGTPASGVATNLTGTAAGLTAGNVTTNANLTGPITSTGNATAVAAQTGTGSTFVMQASPTLTTPNLGTPSAAVLTSATGLPLTSGVTGTLPIANGGSNSTTAGGALDNFTSATSIGGQWFNRTATGTWSTLQAPLVLGSYNVLDYAPNLFTETSVCTGSAACTTTDLQKAIIAAREMAFTLKAASNDDQMWRACVEVILPRGQLSTTSPTLFPPLTCWNGAAYWRRIGTGGTATVQWVGNFGEKANTNLEQPTVIIAPLAHNLGHLDVYAKNTTDGGSGVAAGKVWVGAASTLQTSGACGYSVSDVLTEPQMDNSPFVAGQVTVDTIDGSGCILTYHQSRNMIMSEPLGLQEYEYTAANGWTGAIATPTKGSRGGVFDPSNAGWYITSGGTGSGAEFTITYNNDFNGTGGDYSFGTFVQGNSLLGDINVQQSGNVADATYGHTFALGIADANDFMRSDTSTGGYYGLWISGATDLFWQVVNPVNATIGIKAGPGGGSFRGAVTIDSPTLAAIELDKVDNVNLWGDCLQKNSGITGAATVILGGNGGSAGNLNSQVNIDMSLYNCGGTSKPAASVAFTTASNLKFKVSNINKAGTAVSNVTSSIASFGTGATNNTYTGSIASLTPEGALFSGTLDAASYVDVWDAALNARVTSTPVIPGGRITTSSTLPVLNGGSGSVTTVYYLPYISQKAPSFDGTTWEALDIGASGINVGINSTETNAHSFDVYLVNNAGTPSLCYMYWGAATSRSASAGGTGAQNASVTQLNGVWVNAAAVTTGNCVSGATGTSSLVFAANQGTLLGSFETTSTGHTNMTGGINSGSGGSQQFMGISNAYNRVPISISLIDSATAITSSTASWAKLGANDNFFIFDTLGQGSYSFSGFVVAGNNTIGDACQFGIAIDGGGTATPVSISQADGATGTLADNYTTLSTSGIYPPHIGQHNIYMEIAAAAGTCTFMPVTTNSGMRLDATY